MSTIPNLNPIPEVTGDDLLITHDITTNRSGRVSAEALKDYILLGLPALDDINFVTLESFGAVGDGVTYDGPAWDLAVASNKPIRLLDKNYRIGQKSVQRNGVVIIGTKMPTQSPARDRLEGGSILLGTLIVDGNNVLCENFGVDCGITYTDSYTASTGADAFVAHNIAQLGVLNKNNHFRNIIGLTRIGDYTDPQAAFHGVLLESLIDGSADNIVGVNGWFGVVLKVTDFNCGNLYGIENDSVSVQIKSNSYGFVSRVNINNVICKNYTARGYVGFLVVASDAELSTITINNVSVMEGNTSVKVLAEVVQPTVGVTINNISSRDAGGDAVSIQGPCYSTVIGNINVWNPAGAGFSTSANTLSTHPIDVTVENIRVKPSATTTNAVNISSNITKAILNNINVSTTDGETLVAGSVINIQSSTDIGVYRGVLKYNGVSPALVNGWAAAFGQPYGVVSKSGITIGYGRISATSATSDVFMTIPFGMVPENLDFFTSITAHDGVTGKPVPVTVNISSSGALSVYPNRAAYSGVSWFNLSDLKIPSRLNVMGSI